MTLANTPVRWTSDRFPEEFTVRKYIFDTWRKICTQFGYQEYLSPLVENAEIYRAKSGEDVGGSELTLLTDRKWEISELALRPEMTPSVTRMITKIYGQEAKPIRYFSIANFYRNERPQRGRNREFRQLNVDIFGTEQITADTEILQLAIELMKAFDCPQNSRELHLNHRQLIEYLLDEVLKLKKSTQIEVVRTMDKRNKLTPTKFQAILSEKQLNPDQIQQIVNYMQTKTLEELQSHFPDIANNNGFKELLQITSYLNASWYQQFIHFDASVIRGFDYYDGMIFEVFDLHPDNNRAMFGGWRYNGLANIFGSESIPAIWFAPWDEAIKLFLESWKMIDKIQEQTKQKKYYLPILDQNLASDYQQIIKEYREQDKSIIQWLETQKISKAIKFADKKNCSHIIILWSEEKYDNLYKIKELKTWDETFKNL